MKQYADIKDKLRLNGYSSLKECMSTIDNAMGFGPPTNDKVLVIMERAFVDGMNVYVAELADGALYIRKKGNHFYPMFRQYRH